MATLRFTLPREIDLFARLIVLLGILICFNSCKLSCEDKIKQHKQAGSKGREQGVLLMQNSVDTNSILELAHVGNQLIVDKLDSTYANSIVPFLEGKCFYKVDTCRCGGRYELWEAPQNTPIDVGTVTNPGGSANRPAGILNFIFKPDVDYKDGFDSIQMQVELSCNIGKEVKIVILDSGVKISSDPARDILTSGNWNGFNIDIPCLSTTNIFGIIGVMASPDYLNEPEDNMGHGTSVNGIIAGRSIPNFVSSGLNLKVSNVAIFDPVSQSGTLMDALCALQYAVRLNPAIINMSWGFAIQLNNTNPLVDSMLVMMKGAFGDIFQANNSILFIAGAGNNGEKFNGDFEFIPATLAQNQTNLISVGSLDSTGNDIAYFSNFISHGSGKVSFYAEGHNIVAPFPSNLGDTPGTGLRIMSGTSYATPLVTRYAAVLSSIGFDGSTIKTKLEDAAIQTNSVFRGMSFNKLPSPNDVNIWLCPLNPDL